MSKWPESASPSTPSAPVAESAPVDKPIHEYHAEGEYETSHIRKREIKFSEAFFEPHVGKACGVCHELYSIDKDECEHAKNKAKVNCFRKAKAERDNFMAKKSESGSTSEQSGEEEASGSEANTEKLTEDPHMDWGTYFSQPNNNSERKLRLGSEDEFFTETYLRRTCKICADVGGVNHDNCIADTENARSYCKMTIKEMRPKFNTEWDKGPSTEAEPAPDKSCEVCHKLYGINKDDCTKAKKDAKLNCYKKAKDDRSNFMSKWQESSSKSVPSGIAAEHAPADKHPPSDKHPPAAESAPADKHPPSDKHPPAAESAPADKHHPADKHPPAAESAPANKPPPAAESAPAVQSDQLQDSNHHECNLSQSLPASLDESVKPEDVRKSCKLIPGCSVEMFLEILKNDKAFLDSIIEGLRLSFADSSGCSLSEKSREDKVSDVRKRESSMKFTDHFSASHLKKSCDSDEDYTFQSLHGEDGTNTFDVFDFNDYEFDDDDYNSYSSVEDEARYVKKRDSSMKFTDYFSSNGVSSGPAAELPLSPKPGCSSWSDSSVPQLGSKTMKVTSRRAQADDDWELQSESAVRKKQMLPVYNKADTVEFRFALKRPYPTHKHIFIPDTNLFMQDDSNFMTDLKASLYNKMGDSYVLGISSTMLHELDSMKNNQSDQSKRSVQRTKATAAVALIKGWLNGDKNVRGENPRHTAAARQSMVPLPTSCNDDKILEWATVLEEKTVGNVVVLLTEDPGFRCNAILAELNVFDIKEIGDWVQSESMTL